MSGPCVTPGDAPNPKVREIFEAPRELLDEEPGVGAARWSGCEIADEEGIRDGIGEL